VSFRETPMTRGRGSGQGVCTKSGISGSGLVRERFGWFHLGLRGRAWNREVAVKLSGKGVTWLGDQSQERAYDGRPQWWSQLALAWSRGSPICPAGRCLLGANSPSFCLRRSSDRMRNRRRSDRCCDPIALGEDQGLLQLIHRRWQCARGPLDSRAYCLALRRRRDLCWHPAASGRVPCA
jgi:hypothetical protein